MSSILIKPKSTIADSAGKYEKLGLIENPFPGTPFVNKAASDDRYNGKIYESRIREKEYSEIVDNFLKVPQSSPHHLRLGYILDTSYVGRGNGKSAFTLNLIKDINKDYCLSISNNENKCFGLHVSPETGGKTRTFDDLIDLIFESILDNNIIKYSLASLRLEAITETTPEKIDIEKEFKGDEDIIEKLNDPKWFESKEIDPRDLANQMFKKTELSKLSSTFPLYHDRQLFYSSRCVSQTEFKTHYYNNLKKTKDKINFIFNDMVLFFLSSGFNGAYIIIDDFERIPDFQSEKLKQDFALEIRTNFFDGMLENAKIGFYNLILVLHAGVPRLVEKAWSVSGMERRSPMLNDKGSKHIIKFDKLNIDHAEWLIEKYLEKYKITPDTNNKFAPFDKEVIALLGEKSELNASTILEKAHFLIEAAVKQDVSKIDKAFFNKEFDKNVETNEEISDDISKTDSTDLFDKSKEKE